MRPAGRPAPGALFLVSRDMDTQNSDLKLLFGNGKSMMSKQRPVSRYVLDIRNNGGGLFPAGVDVARMFLQRGDIVLIADSQVLSLKP